MPILRATLDLEAWSSFRPQERANDFEYNFLLYKFKSFYNEVKDFHELHSNCSVTRSAQTSTSTASNEPSVFNSSIKNASLSNSGNQQVTNLNTKKSFFQHQNSVPVSVSPIGPNKHYNSSYNLPSLNNSTSTYNVMSPAKPEIRQRNPALSSRLQISQSSERLDSINNNRSIFSSNIKNRDPDKFNVSASSPPIPRDAKFLQNDDNIYDAVSPDDIPKNEPIAPCNVAASMQNLDKLSLLNKDKQNSSKGSIVLESSSETSKLSNSSSKLVSGNKYPFNGDHELDKTNNSCISSINSDAKHHSSSSLSILAGSPSNQQNDPLFANYVNIDFFLKRSHSPSFDGLEEEAEDEEDNDNLGNDSLSEGSDKDTTHLSNSLSSDQICGDDAPKGVSARDLVKKLGNSSASSITPASSGDFLDDNRSSSLIHSQHHSSSLTKEIKTKSRLSNLFSSIDNENGGQYNRGSSTSPRDSNNRDCSDPIFDQYQDKTTSFVSFNQSSGLKLGHINKDGSALVEAQNTMRSFLSDLNLSPVDDVFSDKAQRRIVKESFAVEFCGRRKLRHLFLFNDVIVCAKYQASSKQKFTFDVKWYLNLIGVSVLDLSDVSNQVRYDKEVIDNQILGIRTNLMLLRGQMQHIKRSKHKQPSKVIKKLKKKRTELEAELVLLLPHLPLVIKHANGKKYIFFLSSNFDRNQWIESIKFLQSQLSTAKESSTTPSSSELQAWIQICRKDLNPSLGTFLLRSNCDDDLLYGDLYISLSDIIGITKPGHYYFCFEVDSYGHFSQKASSAVFKVDSSNSSLNEDYVFALDGAHTLRVLLYEDSGMNTKSSVVGKAHIELSRAWFLDKPVEKIISFSSNCSLKAQLSYSSSELLSMRVPHSKLCPTFGMDITQVCKKEKTNVPLLIQLCVYEVERRGMREVGIYRMSGTSTDIQRLKKAFETNPYIAELLLRDIDINSVTGFLKTYLREIPEGLFSNKLYSKFVAAFNIPQSETLERTKTMLDLFHEIPLTNQKSIIYLVEHLVNVNKYESYNKMSLTNLATVLGPNILKPPTDSSASSSSDPFTAVVIGSMSQAGILYFFLNRKYSNLPLTELDSSELKRASG